MSQALDRPNHQVVVPGGTVAYQFPSTVVKGQCFVVLLLNVVLLAQLEVHVGVIGHLCQGFLQQCKVAALLGVELRLHVSVVPYCYRCIDDWQVVGRLFVDPPNVVHASRQDPRDAVAGDQDVAAVAQVAVDTDVVDGTARIVAQCLQVFAAGGQPFIRIQHQVPVGVRVRQCRIAGGGEVVGPAPLVHLGPMGTGNGDGVVGRSRVQHDHLVHPGGDTVQAARKAAGLVLDDHGQGNRFHAGSSSGHDGGLSRRTDVHDLRNSAASGGLFGLFHARVQSRPGVPDRVVRFLGVAVIGCRCMQCRPDLTRVLPPCRSCREKRDSQTDFMNEK